MSFNAATGASGFRPRDDHCHQSLTLRSTNGLAYEIREGTINAPHTPSNPPHSDRFSRITPMSNMSIDTNNLPSTNISRDVHEVQPNQGRPVTANRGPAVGSSNEAASTSQLSNFLRSRFQIPPPTAPRAMMPVPLEWRRSGRSTPVGVFTTPPRRISSLPDVTHAGALSAQASPFHPRTPTRSSSNSPDPRQHGVTSAPGSRPLSSLGAASESSSTGAIARPSVKHLECYYWRRKGHCKYSDDECLYAHHMTGRCAEAPGRVTEGGK